MVQCLVVMGVRIALFNANQMLILTFCYVSTKLTLLRNCVAIRHADNFEIAFVQFWNIHFFVLFGENVNCYVWFCNFVCQTLKKNYRF